MIMGCDTNFVWLKPGVFEFRNRPQYLLMQNNNYDIIFKNILFNVISTKKDAVLMFTWA